MGAYKDLRALSDEEVERLYDEAMGHTVSGLYLYRDELLRRESARRDEQLLKYTKEIRALTVAVAAAAIVALAISVVALIVPR